MAALSGDNSASRPHAAPDIEPGGGKFGGGGASETYKVDTAPSAPSDGGGYDGGGGGGDGGGGGGGDCSADPLADPMCTGRPDLRLTPRQRYA